MLFSETLMSAFNEQITPEIKSLLGELFYGNASYESIQNSKALMDLVYISGTVLVDRHGGEGEGDEYYSVYKFKSNLDEICYIKFRGFYASYSGAEYEECLLVKPVTKTIVVYE